MDSATFNLHLYDPSEEKTYSVSLSQEDYERALRDLNFTQSLLNAARAEEEVGVSDEISQHQDLLASSFQSQNTHSLCLESKPMESNDNSDDGCEEMEESVPPEIDRTVWSYSATIALINSMETHYEHINHPTKRKFVYSNISNDILSAGHHYDAPACQRKWKALVRSYKNAKDHKVKTGRGPSRFLFFDLIDNILGEKPTNKCDHTMESSNMPKPKNEETLEKSNEKTEELPPRKRKKKSYCSEADKKKEERHRERMELEARKVAIEERKVALLEEFVKKK